MAAIPSRHRSLVLLAIMVVGQLLLLAVQVRHERQGRLIRVWTVAVISPFERGGTWGLDRVRGTWNHYFALRRTAFENEALRRERDALQLQVNLLQGKAAEVERLNSLLNFRQAHNEVPLLPAHVISMSADSASQTIFIDRGQKEGVRVNMGVITPDGVVGKVMESYPHIAQVLLVTDKESGVGAMVAESRLQSPVDGAGEPLLLLKYVAEDEVVTPGQHIVTSGMDRIFPKEIPVGTVLEVKPGNPFLQVRVRPAAQLNRLEEVIVLLTLNPLEKKEPAPAPAAEPLKNKPALPGAKKP